MLKISRMRYDQTGQWGLTDDMEGVDGCRSLEMPSGRASGSALLWSLNQTELDIGNTDLDLLNRGVLGTM